MARTGAAALRRVFLPETFTFRSDTRINEREQAWLRHQQQRWLRPDAHRWIRPDAARFLKPGTDPADVYPGFKPYERKYSPSQRRIPRGQTGGGRWTDEQGSGGGSGGGGSGGIFGALSAIGEGLGFSDGFGDGLGEGFDNFDLGDLTGLGEFEGLFSIKPSDLDFEGVQLAQNDGRSGYPVDLLEERELGGHTIEKHVGRSSQSLFNDVDDTIRRARERGEAGSGFTDSSFTSLESANKLVNSTIADNPDKVARVVDGRSPKENLDKIFPSPTGVEAYARNERSQVKLNETYGVRVVIIPERATAKGYRVETAFPKSYR